MADWHDLYDRFTPLEISTAYSGDEGNLLIV